MCSDEMSCLWRRRVLRAVVGVGVSAASLGFPMLAMARQRMPAMTEGPFYPTERPLDDDADLTHVKGQRPAQGEWLDIEGMVIDQNGRTLDRAEIEIWQCDIHGSYRHPRGAGPRIDAGFQGFGAAVSDARGAYRFRTIRPVPYTGRAPHIHVKVRHPGIGEITSQWFVTGEPGNERDFVFRHLDVAERSEVMLELRRLAPQSSAQQSAVWQARRDVVVPA